MVGTLSATAIIGTAAAAPLTGAGALSAGTVMQLPVGAGLTGIGALSGVVVGQMLLAPALGGAGTLAAAFSQTYYQSAPLAGAGALSATAINPVPAFDVLGAGTSSGTSWNHTATAGATAIVICSAYKGSALTFSATYAGLAMTQIGATFNTTVGNYAAMFKLSGVPGGTSTISVTASGAIGFCGNSVTFVNVNSVGTLQTLSCGGGVMSQAVSCTTNQHIIQSFADPTNGSITGYSGGTSLWLASNKFMTLSRAAGATTTFSFTQASGYTGCTGVAVVIS